MTPANAHDAGLRERAPEPDPEYTFQAANERESAGTRPCSRWPARRRLDLVHRLDGYFPLVANEGEFLAEHPYEPLPGGGTHLTFKNSLVEGAGVANKWFFRAGEGAVAGLPRAADTR